MYKLNRSGFTTAELAIASVIGAIGLLGSVSVYSYVGARNRAMETSRASAALGESMKRNLASDQKANWLALSSAGCLSNTSTTLKFPSFSNSEYNVTLLNNARLNVILPANNPDGTPNKLRTAINELISQYGAQASAKCSDSAALQDPKYTALRTAEVTCRCATADTVYGTLRPMVSDFKTRTGLYACVEVTAKSSASQNSQTTALLGGKPVIAESSYSLFNVNDNSQNTCQQLAGAVPAKALSRLDYSFYAASQENASPIKNSGSFLMD